MLRTWVRFPSPAPLFRYVSGRSRKIYVDSAALTHQPFLDLRPKRLSFAPILRPTREQRERYSSREMGSKIQTRRFQLNSI